MTLQRRQSWRFLIVDDAPAVRLALSDCLQGLRVPEDRIHVAENAQEGLEAFRSLEPDAVFLDVQMPGDMDGLELGALMLAERPRVRIVVITGLGPDEEQLTQLRSAGVFHVLHKPVKFEDIERTVDLMDREANKLQRIS